MDTHTHCLNCAKLLSTPYCGACGQKKAEPITFGNVIKMSQQAIVQFESPFLKTLWGLTIRPGQTCREYLAGRRVSYANPLKYAFWLLTLLLITAAGFDTSIIDNINKDQLDELSTTNETTTIHQILVYLEHGMLYGYFITALAFAWGLRLLFRKSGYRVAEFYVVGILLMSHLTIFYDLLIVFSLYDSQYGDLLVHLGNLCYLTWGIGSFFSPFRWLNYVKALLFAIIGPFLMMFLIVFGGSLFLTGSEVFKDTLKYVPTITVTTNDSSQD